VKVDERDALFLRQRPDRFHVRRLRCPNLPSVL
jgi:hypothetical protein